MPLVIDMQMQHNACLGWQVRAKSQTLTHYLVDAVIVATLTIVTMFVLSYWLGTCVTVPKWRFKNYGYTFYCPEGGKSAPWL